MECLHHLVHLCINRSETGYSQRLTDHSQLCRMTTTSLPIAICLHVFPSLLRADRLAVYVSLTVPHCCTGSSFLLNLPCSSPLSTPPSLFLFSPSSLSHGQTKTPPPTPSTPHPSYTRKIEWMLALAKVPAESLAEAFMELGEQ